MSLPKSWTTVTPLSKTIAMVVFIFLPTLTFFAGMRYQQKLDTPLIDTQSVKQTDYPFEDCKSQIISRDKSTRIGEYKIYRSISEALQNPEGVCYLDLSRQNLTEFPLAILTLRNVQTIWLGFNRIRSLPPEVSLLKNLKTIDLTGNPITLPEVENLRKQNPGITILFIH